MTPETTANLFGGELDPNLETSVKECLQILELNVTPVAQFVDGLSIQKGLGPDRFGMQKFEHAQNLASQTDAIAQDRGLTPNQTELLRVILTGHDTGRHIEAITGINTIDKTERAQTSLREQYIRHMHSGQEPTPDTYDTVDDIVVPVVTALDDYRETLTQKKRGVRHGMYSMLFLRSIGVLYDLPDDARYIIEQAVFWHAEKEVNIEKPPHETDDSENLMELAEKLCYVLRDLDKLDIFAADYLDPENVYKQIRMHYLKPEERAKLPQMNQEALSTLDGIVKTKEGHTEESPYIQIVHEKLNAGIDISDGGALERFNARQPLDIPDVKHSYANYMLFHVAMIFDLRGRRELETLYVEQFEPVMDRLHFIKSRVDPEVFDQIVDTLSTHISEELDGQNIKKEDIQKRIYSYKRIPSPAAGGVSNVTGQAGPPMFV